MYADNLSLFFSFISLCLCLCLRRPGLHGMEIVPFSCAWAYACVVGVNRDDANISKAQAQGAYACVAPVYT